MIQIIFSIIDNEHIIVQFSSNDENIVQVSSNDDLIVKDINKDDLIVKEINKDDLLVEEFNKISISKQIDNEKLIIEHLEVNEIRSLYNFYPNDFMDWVRENGLNVPRINSNCGQALALLLHNKNKYVLRQDLELFFNNLGRKCGDAIQTINKTEQWGLKLGRIGNRKGIYFISKYELGTKHLIRKNFKFKGSKEDKNRMINAIKAQIKADYLDVPNDDWEVGHMNPGKGGIDDNFVFQPPIQGRYRDEYIFFDTLTKMPSPEKLVRDNFSCYTVEQRKMLYEALRLEFESK